MRGGTPSLPYTLSWCGVKLSVEILSYEFPTFTLDSHFNPLNTQLNPICQ